MLPLVLKTARPRPRGLVGAVRGDARGRDRHRHLLPGGGADPPRHAALTRRRGSLSTLRSPRACARAQVARSVTRPHRRARARARLACGATGRWARAPRRPPRRRDQSTSCSEQTRGNPGTQSNGAPTLGGQPSRQEKGGHVMRRKRFVCLFLAGLAGRCSPRRAAEVSAVRHGPGGGGSPPRGAAVVQGTVTGCAVGPAGGRRRHVARRRRGRRGPVRPRRRPRRDRHAEARGRRRRRPGLRARPAGRPGHVDQGPARGRQRPARGRAELRADRRDVLLGHARVDRRHAARRGRAAPVDASQVGKVWRGERRIQLSDAAGRARR